MQTKLLTGIISLLLFASCGSFYYYRLPNESEQKRIPADSLRWGYSGTTITNIAVADESGNFYRLPVTPKTKVEIKTTFGETYRFYLQAITIQENDALLGTTQTWTGYDVLQHIRRTVKVSELASVSIISENQARTSIYVR